jgi:hypothetical protein
MFGIYMTVLAQQRLNLRALPHAHSSFGFWALMAAAEPQASAGERARGAQEF